MSELRKGFYQGLVAIMVFIIDRIPEPIEDYIVELLDSDGLRGDRGRHHDQELPLKE